MASFKEAFKAARKEKGAGKTFEWNGKSYTTDYKEEVKGKSKPASKPTATRPKPNPGNKPPSVMSEAPAPPDQPEKNTRNTGTRRVSGASRSAAGKTDKPKGGLIPSTKPKGGLKPSVKPKGSLKYKK